MKHNIIISGVPRAGKTTLAHMLSLQGFHHIAMDAIIAGFEACFPDLGINTYQDLSSLDTLNVISGKIAPFINAMLESNQYSSFEHGMVIDIYQLLPSDFNRYIDPKNCDAYWLGTADVTPDERLVIQRKYDTEQDYSFYKTDEELREGAVYQVEQSCMKSQADAQRLKWCLNTDSTPTRAFIRRSSASTAALRKSTLPSTATVRLSRRNWRLQL